MKARVVMPWVLAAAGAALAATGFLSSHPLAEATRGLPGVMACFFYLLLVRTRALSAKQVDTLGSWLLPAGGAAITLGALCGASTLFTPVASGAALPLCVVGGPLAAVASLRLSTAVTRKSTFYSAAFAQLVMAALGVALVIRTWPWVRFGI